MKNTFLTFILVFSASLFAKSADYTCDAGFSKVDIFLTGDKSTVVALSDRMGLIFQSYASVVEVKKDKTFFYFYPGQADPARVIFWSSDVANMPERITGRIDTKARGFLLREELDCTRK